jgi:hypothetical protein
LVIIPAAEGGAAFRGFRVWEGVSLRLIVVLLTG